MIIREQHSYQWVKFENSREIFECKWHPSLPAEATKSVHKYRSYQFLPTCKPHKLHYSLLFLAINLHLYLNPALSLRPFKNVFFFGVCVRVCVCVCLCVCVCVCVCVVQDSVVGLATCWTVQGSNPSGDQFSTRVQTENGAHEDSSKVSTWSFLGVTRPELSFNHPIPSNAEVKERGELQLYSPSVSSWKVVGWFWRSGDLAFW